LKEYNSYIIDEEYSGKSIKEYLTHRLFISHRTLVKLKKGTFILLNDKPVFVTEKLKNGDKLDIILMDEESENIIPEAIDLDIVYEDDYMIIINKLPGMPVHPTRGHFTGTVANALVYHYRKSDKNIKIRPINRLDKDTSGLVMFAKNPHIQHLMSMEGFRLRKKYIAVVEGSIEEDKGIIDLPIKREAYDTIKRIVHEEGQKAITEYEVIKKNEKASLLSIHLITGRTHQIRVHMSHIGHPLYGDRLYGGNADLIKRQALHAEKLVFQHPVNQGNMEITAQLPYDMEALCEVLGLQNVL